MRVSGPSFQEIFTVQKLQKGESSENSGGNRRKTYDRYFWRTHSLFPVAGREVKWHGFRNRHLSKVQQLWLRDNP